MDNTNGKKLQLIQQAVGEWAKKNFGDNLSAVDHDCTLRHHAPLLGIGEELGEVAAAMIADDPNELLDGIADVGVYLCDHATRLGVDLWSVYKQYITPSPGDGLYYLHAVAAYGQLSHVNLKTAQGIRGFDDKQFAADATKKAISLFLQALEDLCEEETGRGFVDVLEQVFVRVVKPRDWVANPEGA